MGGWRDSGWREKGRERDREEIGERYEERVGRDSGER